MRKSMLVGLIGSNISHSLSPALHEDAFAAAGIVGHYHLMDVARLKGRQLPELLAAVRTAGFDAINVTHPFKEAVLPLLDEVSAGARQIGAVNTVVVDHGGRTVGHNTDRSGFRRAFEETLGKAVAQDKHVLVLGAGGAGRAVAFALMDLGVGRILVHAHAAAGHCPAAPGACRGHELRLQRRVDHVRDPVPGFDQPLVHR